MVLEVAGGILLALLAFVAATVLVIVGTALVSAIGTRLRRIR